MYTYVYMYVYVYIHPLCNVMKYTMFIWANGNIEIYPVWELLQNLMLADPKVSQPPGVADQTNCPQDPSVTWSYKSTYTM